MTAREGWNEFKDAMYMLRRRSLGKDTRILSF